MNSAGTPLVFRKEKRHVLGRTILLDRWRSIGAVLAQPSIHQARFLGSTSYAARFSWFSPRLLEVLLRVFVFFSFTKKHSGASNENIVQNHLNIALLNVFSYLKGRYRHIFIL